MKKHRKIKMKVDGVTYFWRYEIRGLKKNTKWQHYAIMFIICQKLRHVASYLKNTIKHVLIDVQNNLPKRPQCDVNDVESVDYCRLHV